MRQIVCRWTERNNWFWGRIHCMFLKPMYLLNLFHSYIFLSSFLNSYPTNPFTNKFQYSIVSPFLLVSLFLPYFVGVSSSCFHLVMLSIFLASLIVAFFAYLLVVASFSDSGSFQSCLLSLTTVVSFPFS